MHKKNWVDRFWGKVYKQDGDGACWLWQGAKVAKGYGKFGISAEKVYYAHRVAWALENGGIEILEEVPLIRHKCHVTSCVRPDHLHPGTAKDNAQDRVQAGRQARGESGGGAKLKTDQVFEAVRLYRDENLRCGDIGKKLGISGRHVASILRGERWAHLDLGLEELPPPQQGERAPNAKITTEQVISIREEYAAGSTTQKQLAEKYNLGKETIRIIVSGEAWKSVGGPIHKTNRHKSWSNDQILAIRMEYARGEISKKEIAAKYHTSQTSMSRILSGETFPDAGGPLHKPKSRKL